MTDVALCTVDLDNCPLWADGLPVEDIFEKCLDEDCIRIRNCRISFDSDGVLVIEGLKSGRAKQ